MVDESLGGRSKEGLRLDLSFQLHVEFELIFTRPFSIPERWLSSLIRLHRLNVDIAVSLRMDIISVLHLCVRSMCRPSLMWKLRILSVQLKWRMVFVNRRNSSVITCLHAINSIVLKWLVRRSSCDELWYGKVTISILFCCLLWNCFDRVKSGVLLCEKRSSCSWSEADILRGSHDFDH